MTRDRGETFTCGGFTLTRNAGETWRDAVRRMASMHGLADECADAYDRNTEPSERVRAWSALREWDCLAWEAGS